MSNAATRHFRLVPIESSIADRLRATGGIRHTADTKPGYPCRHCLRDAEIGEELILVAYDPFTQDSPYRSTSPIFLHAEPCVPALGSDALPEQLTVRTLSVRAFDDQAMMTNAEVIEGRDLENTIERFFADTAVDQIHVHNASPGCWAVTVTRA